MRMEITLSTRIIKFLVSCILLFIVLVHPYYIGVVYATSPTLNPSIAGGVEGVSTSSTLASTSGVATPSATPSITQSIDITQPEAAKSSLSIYLDKTATVPLRPWNAIQHALRNAVNKGVPANMLVLLLLFPITATIISAFRHIIGLRGFGVYTPAVLAVAFISLGIIKGLIIFFVVFAAAMIGRPLVNFVRLQYLPRTALLLWFVSSVMFGLFLLSPYLPFLSLATIGIFPLLMIILLSEHFLEAQLFGNLKTAVQLTGETLILAICSALFMRTFEVQKFVIIFPEITMIAVLIVNVLVGKYTGLRILEFFRFKPIIDPEE